MILLLFLLVSVAVLFGCSEPEYADFNELMQYRTVKPAKTEYIISYDSLDGYLSEGRNEKTIASITVTDVRHYLDYNQKRGHFEGHTIIQCEIDKISDKCNQLSLKVGNKIEIKSNYYFGPETDEELLAWFGQEKGVEISSADDLKNIESCSFEFKPLKGSKGRKFFNDNDFPFNKGSSYTLA